MIAADPSLFVSQSPDLPLFLSFHWGEMGNISLSAHSSSLRKLQGFLFSLAFNELSDPVPFWKTQFWSHKHHTTLGNQKVFSIITYYICLANQKHLWQIWLKQPQNISKIVLMHAGSGTHTGRLHCTIVSVGLFAGCFSSWPQLRKWISNMVRLPEIKTVCHVLCFIPSFKVDSQRQCALHLHPTA